MREKIALIRGYLRYLAAICNWVASVIALETFPKKSDYLPEPDPGANNSPSPDPVRDQSPDGPVLDSGIKV